MKYALLLAAISLAGHSWSQKINNHLEFRKGQKLEMVLQVNSLMTQAMGDTKVDATITSELNVADIKNNQAQVDQQTKRVQYNINNPMMGSQEFDSEKESDMNSDMGKQLGSKMKESYTMTLDGTGKVLAVQTNNAAATKNASDGADMMGGMMGGLSDGISAPKPGEGTDFRVLPDREVSKGESWTDTSFQHHIMYTLDDVTGDEILVSFTEHSVVEKKQEVMGQEISLTSNNDETGKIILDRKTGLLKKKTSTIHSEGTAKVMGQSMPINSTSNKTLLVRSL